MGGDRSRSAGKQRAILDDPKTSPTEIVTTGIPIVNVVITNQLFGKLKLGYASTSIDNRDILG